MEIFPETLVALNLTFQDAGLPLPQDTYRTGVTEIHSEGSRFGFPNDRFVPQDSNDSLLEKLKGNDSWQRISWIGNAKKDCLSICLYAMRTYSLSVNNDRCTPSMCMSSVNL